MKQLPKKIIIQIIALAFAIGVQAGTSFKVAVIAPEGTSWAEILKNMAQEVAASTSSQVEFRVYYGGSQGDEPDVLRKMRTGQLHGGFFTGKTLGEINGDVRVMELPFTFYGDDKKAMAIMDKMTPTFNKTFDKRGIDTS